VPDDERDPARRPAAGRLSADPHRFRVPPPGRGRRSRVLELAAVLALLGITAAIVVVVLRTVGGEGPRDALDAFVADWSRGDDRAAAAATDQPSAALAALAANRSGLDGARLSAAVDSLADHGERANARVRMQWDVPGVGRWGYDTQVALLKRDGKWAVRWTPTVVHPDLDAKTRLGTTRAPATRGAIRDRRGRSIVTARPVVRVGVVAGKVRDARATAAALGQVVDVDEAALVRAIRGGGPEQFVPAITLRREDARPLEARLKAIRGVQLIDGRDQLAPTRGFARALLGTVGPATAEQLGRLGRGYAEGDEVGQWGLEARFERRLAGTPTRRVVIREGGMPIDTLFGRSGKAGRSLRTTIDSDVQSAAEQALGSGRRNAALVAIQPSTGDVLAVANRPLGSSYDRALEGRYPPGSTFKVVTTAGLLRRGVTTGEVVDCPRTTTVGGRAFRNFEGSARGAVPFAEDFAQSCNTAFVSLSGRLRRGDLTRVAREFGLGRELALPLPAPAASVPAARDDVSLAAMSIGQDRILASPLAMAGVVATVADGRWRAPRLVASDPHHAGEPVDAGQIATLRGLMRRVVTQGTGTALAGVAGAPAGKSGTAEFGPGNPPDTHAWFVAYRGDLAVAVLVEGGRSGGRVAAPIVARFLAAL
jgi:cell division protein FtsI/penicillin-binding protein 2